MQLLYTLEAMRTPFLDIVMSLITRLGEELVFMVVAVFIFWCVDKYRGYYLLTVGFVGTVINQFLKILCCIPRPWVIDPDFTIVESARAQATGYSFPSGHTQNAVGTFGGIALFTRRKWLRWILVVLAVLTAFSRMYLGVHTLLDVGVALVTAVILLLVCYPIIEKARNNKKYLFGIAAGMIVLSAAFWLYLILAGAPCAQTDVNYENYVHALGNAQKMLGSTVGILLVAWLDETYVRFDTKAVWWAQILKLVLGLGLTVAVKSGLKAPLHAVIPGIADAIRYFLMVFTVGYLWPLTFRFWSKLGKKK